jgi:hypothetical protein
MEPPEWRKVWGNEPSHSQGSFHFGSWSPSGLLNIQRTIEGVKTNWIKEFLISLKRYQLKRKCLKWARMTHLDIWNVSYGQKKGHESNWQFDSWPLKVRNQPDFLVWRWRVTYRWKARDEGYNFASDLILIRGLRAKLCGPKVTGVPIVRISGLPFGAKCHLDVGLVERHKVYYKGEGGSFPQVRAVVSFVSPKLPMACPITKSAPIMH